MFLSSSKPSLEATRSQGQAHRKSKQQLSHQFLFSSHVIKQPMVSTKEAYLGFVPTLNHNLGSTDGQSWTLDPSMVTCKPFAHSFFFLFFFFEEMVNSFHQIFKCVMCTLSTTLKIKKKKHEFQPHQRELG